MVWIILVIMSFVLMILAFIFKDRIYNKYGIKLVDAVCIFLITIFIASSFILFFLLVAGATDYSYLIGQKIKTDVYIKYLDDVKQVQGINLKIKNYDIKYSTTGQKIIYIENTVKNIAKYNNRLVKCKYIKNSTVGNWFREGLFISSKVLELEEIK